ncbi:MAG TPA: hypothetical protein DDW85_07430 [Porphyromonadaceae bacterium]|nr:hypothetical protein [Porphyromonadaceae bacterium]
MKFTTQLFLYWVSIFLIFFLAIIVIMSVFWGLNLTIWQALSVFLIAGVVPPAIISLILYKRLNYMESEDLQPPAFHGSKQATFKFKSHSKHPFDDILQRIDRQWIISYSDRPNHVVKFRTDARMISWGIGGYVKMIAEDQLLVVVYPIFENSRREERIMNQTLRLMQAILNP